MKREYSQKEVVIPTPIAWFDAIDNQNTGTHSTTTTTWVDRMDTGWVITNNINTGHSTWADKYLDVHSNGWTPYVYRKFWELGTGDFTYEVTARINAVVNDYMIGLGAGTYRHCIAYHTGNVYYFGICPSTWERPITYTVDLLNKLVHMTATRINGVLYLYLNNVLVGQTKMTYSLTTVNGNMPVIGGKNTHTYSGKVYNVGLTAEQVTAECAWAENYYGITLDNIE